MPQISVIIPVYNCEQYLEKCINSILTQTFEDFELLLVDDGSTDISGIIADAYEKKDSRIQVFHKNNGGASSARNAGLENARGEFITFIDSDDSVEPCYLEYLIRIIVNDNADLACYSYKDSQRSDNDREKAESLLAQRRIFYGKEILADYLGTFLLMIWNVPFNKLFRRKVFQDVRFVEGMIYEDDEILPRLILNCEKVSIIPLELYNYTASPNSVMRASFSQKRLDILRLRESQCKFFYFNGYPKQARGFLYEYMFKMIYFDRLTDQDDYREYRSIFLYYRRNFKKNKTFYLKMLDKKHDNLLKLAIISYPVFYPLAFSLIDKLCK